MHAVPLLATELPAPAAVLIALALGIVAGATAHRLRRRLPAPPRERPPRSTDALDHDAAAELLGATPAPSWCPGCLLTRLDDDGRCPDCGWGSTYVAGHDSHGRPWIRCLSCGRTSWHPADVLARYCGGCRRFHDPRLRGSGAA